MRRPRALAVLLALACSAPAQDRLTPELLWQLARVSDPQLAPDGNRLLYEVRTTDLAANKGTSQLFVLDLASHERRQLTSGGSNSNGRWSPDGQQVAFVSTRSGQPQIWVIAIDGGEARQITRHAAGVSN